jgi:putative oxidoreductase
MELLFIIGRLILGLYFLHAGFNHFFKTKAMAAYAASKGVPLATTGVIVSGITFTIGGISLIGWIAPLIGLALLIITMIPVTVLMHTFWKHKDPMQRSHEQISFNKNLAIMGAMILIVALLMALSLAV